MKLLRPKSSASPAKPAEAAPVAATGPGWSEAPELHDIAHQLVQRHLNPGRRGVVLCGASAGTGVRFVGASLALAVASMGASTLFMDANLRSPAGGPPLDAPPDAVSLTQLLTSETDLVDSVYRSAHDNLSIIPAGDRRPDADELLAGAKFRGLLDRFLRRYECVLISAPPANRFVDARTLAAAVGYSLIVGRSGYSFLQDTDLLANQLRQCGSEIVGCIFNDA